MVEIIKCSEKTKMVKKKKKTTVHFIWHVMTERLFSLPLTKVGIHFGHVRMYATPYPISWIIFI